MELPRAGSEAVKTKRQTAACFWDMLKQLERIWGKYPIELTSIIRFSQAQAVSSNVRILDPIGTLEKTAGA